MNKIIKFFIAHSTYRPVWRVKYSDGRLTRLLPYNEAKGCKLIFGGKMFIDYDKGYF